jgi:ABC-type multidrug transport system fused ATPase/permease subunit
MNVRVKARLASILNWLATFILLLVALAFIYSAQVFQDRDLSAWANVFTTIGSAMLSLVSVYMGIQLQQARSRKDERRAIRRAETSIHREYLQEVGDLVEQLKRAKKYADAGEQDESDLIRYRVRERLFEVQEAKPSANNISDDIYKGRIESAIEQVAQFCDEQIVKSGDSDRIDDILHRAFAEISDYENIE